jgi:hypothetical protein
VSWWGNVIEGQKFRLCTSADYVPLQRKL